MSNYPEDFRGTNMDYREDTEQQDALDNMFRNREEPISVADTFGGMKGESALFQCFNSPALQDQINAMNNLTGEQQ